MNAATVHAPATVANVAVGFDLLGFAVEGPGDRVTVRRGPPGVRVTVSGLPSGVSVPLDPTRNTATVGLLAMLEDLRPGCGLDVHVEKGIPLGSGLGGSAASAVGGVVAADALLGAGLSREVLLAYALQGEAVASGAPHADNAAPCLFGGFTLAHHGTVQSLPVPDGLQVVLCHPDVRIDTRDARAVLPAAFPRDAVVAQTGNLASLLVAAFRGDALAFAHACRDALIEPYRAPLIPHFAAAREAAERAGALAFSISGSGPTLFALATPDRAAAVREALVATYTAAGLAATGHLSRLGGPGARVL